VGQPLGKLRLPSEEMRWRAGGASGDRQWPACPVIRASRALLRTCPNRMCLYYAAMTQAVTRILDEVQRLTDAERQELRRAIVERVPMSDDLTDDDFAALAAASFRALDEEEDAPSA
jgi:hypothetical protein